MYGIVYNTNMAPFQVVLDTNVLVAALRSKRGASYRLLNLLGDRRFDINVSVPLVLEYEKAAKGNVRRGGLSARNVDDILDYVCAVAHQRKVFYLWRPFLRDPKDDMVLELAVAAGCDFIITYNKKDFRGIRHFGIKALSPKEFLERIGELK
jgi:putative PIN family toxin of toxin-antitoxin system